MTTSCTIYHSTIGTKYIKCRAVSISGKKNNEVKPLVNGSRLAEVSTVSYDNLVYKISGMELLADTTTLQYTDILKLYKEKYSGGTTAPVLTIISGKGTATSTVPACDETAAGIKVILESFDVPYDTKESIGAYMPTISLTFIETY